MRPNAAATRPRTGPIPPRSTPALRTQARNRTRARRMRAWASPRSATRARVLVRTITRASPKITSPPASASRAATTSVTSARRPTAAPRLSARAFLTRRQLKHATSAGAAVAVWSYDRNPRGFPRHGWECHSSQLASGGGASAETASQYALGVVIKARPLARYLSLLLFFIAATLHGCDDANCDDGTLCECAEGTDCYLECEGSGCDQYCHN